MIGELIAKSTLILVGIVLCALGAWHNDKMVAFEDWFADRIGYVAAKVYIKAKLTQTRIGIKFIDIKIHITKRVIRLLEVLG